MPVYYIFKATFIPSVRIASWTCPIDAAANGNKLISRKFLYQSWPNALSKFLITYLIGIISASDLAFSIASLITGGRTLSSYADII